MSRIRRVGSGIQSQAARPVRWWAALDPLERVFYRAVVALAIGFGVVWPPLAFIVPGLLWALVFFGFSLRKGT